MFQSKKEQVKIHGDKKERKRKKEREREGKKEREREGKREKEKERERGANFVNKTIHQI